MHFTKRKEYPFFEHLLNMLILYRFSLFIYARFIWLAALFNKKAGLFIKGRKAQARVLKNQLPPEKKCIWFHFPSLGEFEQGRPVLEQWKLSHPQDPVVITFFSPSGFEVRKNYALADRVLYLPMDGKKRAAEFIEQINPRLAVFTKYDLWYYYITTLKKLDIPVYVISAIFRADQVYFKKYGSMFRKILHSVSWFFVQDQNSVDLLNSAGIRSVSISGDTRFDRVWNSLEQDKQLPEIARFAGSSPVLVAGSTWPADEKLLNRLMNDPAGKDWKFIIAPHELQATHLDYLLNTLPGEAVLYSEWIGPATLHRSPRLLIIDNIGMLSALYKYGTLAYTGGGFGSGIHNILEAGVFGLPVIFGPRYQKFKEAADTIREGASFSVQNAQELVALFSALKDPLKRNAAGLKFTTYIQTHRGATAQILQHLDR